MGFLDALRRSLGGEASVDQSPREVEAAFLGVDPDTLPIAEETPFNASNYDRAQWAKKVRRVLEELPESRGDWDDVVAESKAMGFEADWIALKFRTAFTLLVRRAVADRVVTEAEHRKIDLARELIGIPEAEAEAMLEEVVAEAEAFFGRSVEGA